MRRRGVFVLIRSNSSLRITQTAATVAEVMGFAAPKGADIPNAIVASAAEKQFGKERVQRVLLYNPDAVALWLYQKYTVLFEPIINDTQMALPVLSVMPSVTPVCFASMYSGLNPSEHGIQSYTKPVLKCETLFDSALKGGKKPIIISTKGDSISEIFKEREMDYIFCSTPDECNEYALKIISQNEHDIVVVYNGNYDAKMHRTGTESVEAINELRKNITDFERLVCAAKESWKGKNCMAAFLTDHGCHDIDGNLGSHGLEMPEDMDIIHFYKLWK